MKSMRWLLIALPLLTLGACMSHNPYAQTVDDYAAAAAQVTLGMSTAQVAQILAPSQRQLRNHDRKGPERFLRGEQETVIQYYRSGWQADGRLTDDEYTPYLFANDRLIAIGWHSLKTAQRHASSPAIAVIGVVNARELDARSH